MNYERSKAQLALMEQIIMILVFAMQMGCLGVVKKKILRQPMHRK